MIDGDKRKLIRSVETRFNQLASQPDLTGLQGIFGLKLEDAVIRATLVHLQNLGIKFEDKPLDSRKSGFIIAGPPGLIVIFDSGLSTTERMARILHSLGHVRHRHVPIGRAKWGSLMEYPTPNIAPEVYAHQEHQANTWATAFGKRVLRNNPTGNAELRELLTSSIANIRDASGMGRRVVQAS